MPDLAEELKLLIRTRHPLVTIQTPEESFALRLIHEAALQLRLPVMEWSVTEGLHPTHPHVGGQIATTDKLALALAYVRDNPTLQLYVFKDALRVLDNANTERVLREAAGKCSRDSRAIFLIDVGGKLPESVQHLAVPFEVPLPAEEEIRAIIKQAFHDACGFGQKVVEMTRGGYDRFVANLRGLTRSEIAQVVTEAVLGDGKLDDGDVKLAADAKRQRLRRSGMLDFIPAPQAVPEVGGMAALRAWLHRRQGAFSRRAESFGLEPPKGILMLGVQGCGKSLLARHVAAQWQLPLLKLDVGALYDKYVGETERHLRQAFGMAAAMAPCVLWIDEIEKAFASPGGPQAGASDGGLSQRVFGQLLTWMQERTDPVFVVATANDVTALPAEMLRKGRFDEVFFVDLPDLQARGEIFAIHLRKRRRRPEDFDLPALAAASNGFSGAEIEQAIVSALYAAFAEGREVRTGDALTELAATRPLSVLMAEKIAALRAWAQGRCVPADGG